MTSESSLMAFEYLSQCKNFPGLRSLRVTVLGLHSSSFFRAAQNKVARVLLQFVEWCVGPTESICTIGVLIRMRHKSLARSMHWRFHRQDPSGLMASSSLHLDFAPSGSALTPSLPQTQGLVRDISVADTVCCVKSYVPHGEEGMPSEEQQLIWRERFADPSQWQDHGRSKPTTRHPDFRHKKSEVVLWLNNRDRPAWVDTQLSNWGAGTKGPPTAVEGQGSFCKFGAHESHVEVAMCRKLCEDGQIADAVGALSLLVQRNCHVPSNWFYLVLKRCKDLALGRRIHALAVKSGYERDAFVATHLIGLYSWHRRLDEAMRVFRKVSAPSSYNWATIIFAYARHGEPSEAIRLYREMRESTTDNPTDRIYVAVLKACAAAGDLVAGKEIHAHILAILRDPDIFVQTGLVDMYAKCRRLEDARRVFDKLSEKNVVTWNALLAGYAKQGMGQEALRLYNTMQEEAITSPDSVTYVSLLQACASIGVGAQDQGKELHAQIEERGLQVDIAVGNCLVNMYAKSGSVDDARSIFDRFPDRNVVTWTVMIAGYAEQGMGHQALSLYSSMQHEGIIPNSVTFVCLLQACASVGVGALEQGRQLHANIKEQGLQADVVIGNSLVSMYAKCSSVEDARSVFDGLQDRNVITWTAMIAAYADHGMGREALILYSNMRQEGITSPNSVTFVCLLQGCASLGVGALHEGREIHAQIVEQGLQSDMVVCSSLINMYAKCGSLEDARRVFDRLKEKNVVTWTAMIAGCSQHEMGQEALNLYSSMQQEGTTPNTVTFVCLLQACASVGIGALDQGKQLQKQINKQGLQDDVVLSGSLVNMYAKCGSLEGARILFDRLPVKTVVTWNAMIAGYAQQEMGQEALCIYSSMQQHGHTPDSVAFVCLLQACASVGVGGLDQGKQLHAHIKERGLGDDVVVGGSLVNMYAKCGSLAGARSVFEQLPDKNVVTWNVMLTGYLDQGMCQEALTLYTSMEQESVTPDSVTFVCLLQACAMIAALPLGKQFHSQIVERRLQADGVVGAALVNMYAKCGSMADSQQAFDALPVRTIEAWGALTCGYSRQGNSELVFDLLHRMRLEGIQPDGITFLSVLTVCSHVGLLDKGREYFVAMTDYGISRTIEHYACMMDLLGRAGHLDAALQLAKTMPFPPNDVVWLTLLGACQKWKNVEIGEQAFEGAVSVDRKDASAYVLMANIYASAQMWEEAEEVQARRVKSEAWKKPGQTWSIDAGGVVHSFVVEDKKHPTIYNTQNNGRICPAPQSLEGIANVGNEAEHCGLSKNLDVTDSWNQCVPVAQ